MTHAGEDIRRCESENVGIRNIFVSEAEVIFDCDGQLVDLYFSFPDPDGLFWARFQHTRGGIAYLRPL